MPENDQPAGGVLQSLKRVCDIGLGLLQNRAELFAIEFREEKARQVKLALWIAAVAFLSMMAVALVTLTVLVIYWETARIPALVTASAVYVLAAVVAWRGLRNRLNQAVAPFSETLSELRKDREWLQGQPPTHSDKESNF